jgi:ATP-dependent helicase HepA
MSSASTFVRVDGTTEGIGKLVGAFAGKAEIEYFDSPAGPSVRRVKAPVATVRPVSLSAQTRIFWYDPQRKSWVAGRVDGGLVSAQALKASEDHYHVRFPNNADARIPVTELFVRSARPIENPTDYLAHRITDTPFFFEGRTEIVRHIAQQRAAFGGLTGLASSAVDLIEHQVMTVRQVLSDPIQRYVLADEVGLGKTIEAGALIRQHLIDLGHEASVLLVVPDHLVGQWQHEMASKFFLDGDSPIRILSDSRLLEAPHLLASTSMLVIDEAHNICLDAFSPNQDRRARYQRLESVAVDAPSVLLLSGTPVLHQEEGFLAMLHLLEPEAYPLGELDSFRQRVQERKMIAEAFADLRDDASDLFAEDAIDHVAAAFLEDARLQSLCVEARAQLPKPLEDVQRIRSLRSLRTHLSEIYRLHRRLLRSRRVDPKVQEHLPIRKGVQALEVEDHRRSEAYSFVDAWRLAVPEHEAARVEVQELFTVFVESALSHPEVLLRRIDQRLACLEDDPPEGLDSRILSLLSASPVFDGEQEMLKQQRILLFETEPDPRISVLAAWIQSRPDVRKAIVFADDEIIADKVAAGLGEKLGVGAVTRFRGRLKDVRGFEHSSSSSRLLVCDAGAEEGLNLQRSGAAIIHYDLPLEPARIEQRIGRVDRIELRGQLRNVIFASSDPFESEWRAFLVEQVRVFNRSIASLQYVLSEAAKKIRSSLLSEGREAIERVGLEFATPGRSLDDELRRINAEEALDSVEVNADEDGRFFQELVDKDDWLSAEGRNSLNAWVKERLQFFVEDLGRDAMRYLYDLNRPTLLPLQQTLDTFEECIDRFSSHPHRRTQVPLKPFSFDRGRSQETRTPLLRVGHPFLNHLETLVRNDDRGAAFALWRYIPKRFDYPELYFRFDFFIEATADINDNFLASKMVSTHALRRRADDVFPVSYKTLWLSSDLEIVDSSETLTALQLGYSKSIRMDGGRDFNLSADRWELVENLIEIQDWTGLVYRAGKVALEKVQGDGALREACLNAARKVRESSTLKIEALKSRIARLSGRMADAETKALALEEALQHMLVNGVSVPSIRMDSTGVVILASTPIGEI